MMFVPEGSRNTQTDAFSLTIDKTWNGNKVEASETVSLVFSVNQQELDIQINAPFHGDPSPSLPAGELDGLWNYEVVELFLLGNAGHYLEIELGPHGHYLIYHLSGVRQIVKTLSPTRYETCFTGSNWQGTLTLSFDPLILPFSRANAYAIHGTGDKRRYLASFPVPGVTPDFHQPEHFGCIDDLGRIQSVTSTKMA